MNIQIHNEFIRLIFRMLYALTFVWNEIRLLFGGVRLFKYRESYG